MNDGGWPKPCVRCGDQVKEPTISLFQDNAHSSKYAEEVWRIPMCGACRAYEGWRSSWCVKRPFKWPGFRGYIDKLAGDK